MTSLQKTEIEANIAKLIAETVKLNTETETMKFRNGLEFIKVFLYGLACGGVIMGAVAQIMKVS